MIAHAPERMLEIPRTAERREERQKIDLGVYIVRKIKWEEENQKRRKEDRLKCTLYGG